MVYTKKKNLKTIYDTKSKEKETLNVLGLMTSSRGDRDALRSWI